MHPNRTAARRSLWTVALFALALPIALTGCSGDNLAPVSGKVTFKGAPVKGGTLVFSPMGEGRPASAEIKADGTYALGTNYPSDGALVGHHRVTFSPPAQELTEKQRHDPKYIAPPPPYVGLHPKQNETDVKAATNNIDIELVSGPRKR
jgi:hypothetical protein